ncbi:MAG TPA: sugar ABC transporter permease, partial [Pseudonocardia sp.]|nr:sugar ABC transporter permease [Pseudonocardia sp.]
MRSRDTRTAYLLLAPSLFGVAAFLVLPILVVVWMALQRWDLIGPSTFVGLDNVVAVAQDGRFARSLLVTVVFVAIVIPAQTVLGLVAALLLNRGLRGSAVFRVLYVLPWICAPLVLGVVWRWILAPTDGALNALLGRRIEWLADPALALPSVAAVTVWTQVGYVALFFVAGLR